ncbi:hypothetical protein [Clavibacter zhangzhiyongii]|uniref:hypothetical protein n=1 Tax=Clavibacter zhangzhiyongii TaxID=2768071 RepID=UPI0039E14A26
MNIEDSRTTVAFYGMQADAYFAVRMIRQMQFLGDAAPYLAHVMTPWWALHLYESRRITQARLPDLYHPMSPRAEQVFSRARHGTKMFLDNARSVDEYESYFADIASAHARRFTRQSNRIDSGSAEDLAVVHYQGKLVLTSQGTAFAMGLEPESILEANQQGTIVSLFTEAGTSLRLVARAATGPRPAVLDTWATHGFVSTDKSGEWFARGVFTGQAHPHLNAVLAHYTGMVNAVTLLLPLITDLDSDLYVLTKIRFVLVMHVYESLRRLRDSKLLSATASGLWLDFLVDEAPKYANPKDAYLRNLLVHYLPHPKSDFKAFDRDRLLESTVAMTSGEETATLLTRTNELLQHLGAGLNEWMSVPQS